MANTFSQCFYHFVFSTKNRVKFIHPDAYVSPYPDQSIAAVTGTVPTEPQAKIGSHASEP